MSADKYRLKIKVQVINQTTGAVEHTAKHQYENLDNEDVSLMQAPLIEAEQKFNAIGIEGTEKKPTLTA